VWDEIKVVSDIYFLECVLGREIEYPGNQIRYALLACIFHLLDLFFVFLVPKVFMLIGCFFDAGDTQYLVGRW
jgi:hypothetical protein